jgi:hypothetical protein
MHQLEDVHIMPIETTLLPQQYVLYFNADFSSTTNNKNGFPSSQWI